MTKNITRPLFIILCAMLAPFALAQVNNQIVRVKGQGSTPYTGRSDKPGPEIVRQAIIEAKRDALQKYIAQFSTARRANYMKAEAQVMKRLEEVVPNANILVGKAMPKEKLYSVIIDAGIDDNLIEQILQANSVKGRAPGTKQENYITFVFVARELASSTSFDARRTIVTNAETERRGASATGGDGATVTVSEASGATSVAQSGGSSERKANERKYRVFTVGEVDAAVNDVLTTAGYEVVGAADADLNLNEFKADYESGDIQPGTRRAAVGICRTNGILYLGTASMDVGIPERDGATGFWRVYITVNSQVSDLGGRFPKTVASIAGKAYAGLGSNEEVARTNALNTAAKEMAAELVDQLRLKAVQ